MSLGYAIYDPIYSLCKSSSDPEASGLGLLGCRIFLLRCEIFVRATVNLSQQGPLVGFHGYPLSTPLTAFRGHLPKAESRRCGANRYRKTILTWGASPMGWFVASGRYSDARSRNSARRLGRLVWTTSSGRPLGNYGAWSRLGDAPDSAAR